MMGMEQRQYVRGEIVGNVDLSKLFGPLEVPILPMFWYILNVHVHRELKVLKTFRQRNISAWLPLHTTQQDVTRYHRGYQYVQRCNVTSPLISGAILIPDFEAHDGRWQYVDGVVGIYCMDQCIPRLLPKDIVDLRNIEAIGNAPKSKRDRLFEIGELTRVRNGPFAHFSARVERASTAGRLRVGVDIFGRCTSIDIDECDLEKI